ncbi:MAG: NAD-glutamate dehydrogenase, partial [Alphaproteobacteria bacterium]|nr:NAD-glutamate dehydrogenase [Alphaproteobacteria bacterium]
MAVASADSAKRLDQAAQRLRKLMPKFKAEDATGLLKSYFGHVAAEDIAAMGTETLAAVSGGHWRFAESRAPGQDKIRVFVPDADRDGWSADRAVLEVVTDDKPFLVSSLTAEIMRRNHRIHIVIHPVLRVRRDGKNRLAGLAADPNQPGARAESFMHIELEGLIDEAERKELEGRIAKVLADVAVAVKDWREMVGRLQATVEEIDTTPPPLDAAEIAEVKAFLRWMADNHFTLLGCRDYDYRRSGNKEALIPRDKSAFGLMRDPDFRILNVAGMATDLPPMIRDFLKLPRLLIITKANVRSTVHRSTYMDYIGVKRFDMAGRVIGERRFVGLFTSEAYNRSPREVPLLRRKMAVTLERAGVPHNSHDGKALVNIIETYPRDELFQITEEDLHASCMGILQLQERPRVRLFVRQDKFERYVSALVFVPRETYGTDIRHKIEKILARAWQGRNSAFYVQMGDGALTRLHFIVGTTPGNVPRPDLAALEGELIEAARSWDDRLAVALAKALGKEPGAAKARRFAGAFPAAYREATSPAEAIRDIAMIETLAAPGDAAVDLQRGADGKAAEVRFKVHHQGGPIPLSDILPVFENLGLRVVEEVPHHITLGSRAVAMQEFQLVEPRGNALDVGAIKAKFEAAFLAVWRAQAESDALNMLVLRAGLAWREVVILRSLTKYLRQTGIAFSNAYMEATLTNNPGVARLLVQLFHARFDPARERKKATAEAERLVKELASALDAVSNADEDRILRRFLNLMESALRTNYYQKAAHGSDKPYVSIKFDSKKVAELPLPRPLYEVFVYSVRAEAIHLRGGKVARGGIRWSDRREDFRTEILGLMKAQMVKNAVIVPVGAKGGFVCKRLPVGVPPDVVQKEVIECYRTLIRGLLDITDNMKGLKVLPPRDVTRLDEDDPYLVVAADKGTATFSDIANALSRDYGFWLDDAFASGGSAGYDHKKMGITARGAWVAVERHFRELGIDANKANITV